MIAMTVSELLFALIFLLLLAILAVVWRYAIVLTKLQRAHDERGEEAVKALRAFALARSWADRQDQNLEDRLAHSLEMELGDWEMARAAIHDVNHPSVRTEVRTDAKH